MDFNWFNFDYPTLNGALKDDVTLGYEAAEQLGWRAPDCVVAPAASGLLFTRIWKGLDELSMLGLLEPVNTHMYVSPAAGCSPIVNAFRRAPYM